MKKIFDTIVGLILTAIVFGIFLAVVVPIIGMIWLGVLVHWFFYGDEQPERPIVDIPKPTLAFDREKIFAAVDASNVRMSEPSAMKERHNLRGKDGRFVKRPLDIPITRYGVPTNQRWQQ